MYGPVKINSVSRQQAHTYQKLQYNDHALAYLELDTVLALLRVQNLSHFGTHGGPSVHQFLTLRVHQQLVERRVQLKNQIIVIMTVEVGVGVGGIRGRGELIPVGMVLESGGGELVDRFVSVDDFAVDVRQAAVLHHTNGT